MILDYREIWCLAGLRQQQIEDISLEKERFNEEYNLLIEVKETLGKLQRLDQRKWNDEPCVGEIKIKGALDVHTE